MKKFLKLIDVGLILAISLFSLSFILADFFGLTSGDGVLSRIFEPEFFSGLDTGKSILVLLSLIGVRLCFIPTEYRLPDQSPETMLADALREYDATYVREFSDAVEMETYLAKRIQEAKISVKDLSWKDTISDQSYLPKRKKTQKAYEDIMRKASSNIEYREIFVFTELRRIEQFERRMATNKPGYSCAYFKDPGKIPRMQFVIVDDVEIIFASSSYQKLCAVRGDSLGLIFGQYFDTAWERATAIKKGTHVYEDEVSHILGSVREQLSPHQEIEHTEIQQISPPVGSKS